ncbi:MAG: 7-carboxy-7-deazaguanine synthase QueE [Bdellovibrionales bacterium RBG_16_40_8]|nr:MAG: 7-carboxy-7-deazaguanine synthase QueE [Bdellovibrionales bacterium RBG_16_40_8]
MLKINEIFFSIQGESTLAGLPTVFVRTSGCHLRCNYCDTKYAYVEGKNLSIAEIITEVKKYLSKHVCITGGEPLLQKNSLLLMKDLCTLGYNVSLETSGDISCKDVDPRVRKIIDVKTPDSGEQNKFFLENLNLPEVNCEFKFVICSENDFFWAEDFSKKYLLNEKYAVLYSPSFEKIEARWLAEKILKNNSSARLQLQQHKYIWSCNTRGV